MSNPGIIGLRGTGEFSTDFRPTNYRELFALLEPNGTAPLNALLSMTNGEETDDPKFNHFRDEMRVWFRAACCSRARSSDRGTPPLVSGGGNILRGPPLHCGVKKSE